MPNFRQGLGPTCDIIEKAWFSSLLSFPHSYLLARIRIVTLNLLCMTNRLTWLLQPG